MTQLGKPFDNNVILSFLSDKVFSRDWRDPEHWFCIEGIAWAQEAEGFWSRPLQWAKTRMTPLDYYVLMMQDERFVNWETFWLPISDLKLSPGET
jgi:hypothetical protein